MEQITLASRKEFLDNIKPKEGFDFKFIRNFDVNELSNYLKSYDKEWYINKSNQESYLSQRESVSYFITDAFNAHQNSEPYINSVVSLDPKLVELVVEPIILELEKMVDGKYAKSLLAKLPAGTGVPIHCDQFGYSNDGNKVANRQAIYNSMIHRVHVPITTNDKVTFYVNGETKNLKVGEIWEINNNIPHSVHNNGDTDRIHICFDILPYRWL